MSRETDAWRKAIATARAEGHAAGVAEVRHEVLTVLLALIERATHELRDFEATKPEERDEDWREGYHSAFGAYGTADELRRRWERRWGYGGSPEGSDGDAPPVAPEAPTSASVARDVSAVGDGASGGQGERGGHSDG